MGRPGGELDDGDAAGPPCCPGQPRLVLGQPEEVQGAAIIWEHSCDNSTDYDRDKGVKNHESSADIICC